MCTPYPPVRKTWFLICIPTAKRWAHRVDSRRFSSDIQNTVDPVVAFAFQEPENDPRNCCYLWLVRSSPHVDESRYVPRRNMMCYCHATLLFHHQLCHLRDSYRRCVAFKSSALVKFTPFGEERFVSASKLAANARWCNVGDAFSEWKQQMTHLLLF